MKKILLTLSMTLLVMAGFSQAKVELGIKGGLNLANIDTKDALATYNSRTGYHGGLYAIAKVASFGIQPEVLYSVRGTDVDFAAVGNDLKQDFIYVDIPVMIKLYTVAGINIQAGPQFGMLMSVKGKTLDSNNNPVDLDRDSFKNSDLSAAFGVGWDAPFGLNLTARYVVGLNDINNVSGATNAIKNRTFQVAAGLKLFKVGN